MIKMKDCRATSLLECLSHGGIFAVAAMYGYHNTQSNESFLTMVVLMSQAVSNLWMTFLCNERSGALSTACCTGLALLVTACSISSPLLGIGGAWIFVAACAGLMTSFWPAYSIPQTDDDARDEEEVIFQPISEAPQEALLSDNNHLLSSSWDHELHGKDDEEEGAYRLLEMDDDDDDDDDSAHDDEAPTTSESHPSNRIRGTTRLLQLAAPEVLYLYTGCIALLIRLPFSLSIPHFVSTTLSALGHGDFEKAHHEILFLFVFGSIDAALDFWCIFLFGYANQRIVRGVRLDLFAKMIRQEVAFFDTHSSGELSSRLSSDCSEMAGDLTWFFRFSVESVVRIVGIVTYLMIRSPTLGACTLCIIPLVAIINKMYGDWLRQNATQVQEALAGANAVAQEALSNIRTVIAFAAEQKEWDRYSHRIERQFKLNIRQLFMTGVYYMSVSTFLINTVVQASLLWIGSILISQHKLTPEVLLAFMLYQSQLQNETLNLFQSYSSLIKSSGAGDKVFELLDRTPPPPSVNALSVRADESRDTDHNGGNSIQEPRKYDVEMNGITFSYPSRPDQPVLQNLHLEIPHGKSMALVGCSGCGKTTIINLLQRFYDPTGGSIRIDGMELKQMDLLQHRRHIGVVTQDPVLFSGTLRDNITYGVHRRVSLEEVQRVARLAHADGFIEGFPDQYETTVGERGVQLSGGQKQRIAIARAILLNPSLLLLDEATSALDAASEQAVQAALEQWWINNRSMTTVIVAHRLRTVQHADCIAFLQDGCVIEQGTHDELMQRPNGLYRQMVERAGSNGILPDM
jgi:ABC-type multidrug transport system fused ATPase/permease subunit